MTIYEPEQTITVPTDLNLTELLNASARSPLPEDHIIAKDDIENRLITISQLRSSAGRLAHGLSTTYPANASSQQRWAVILPNSICYIEVCHAILWLGGIFCPINHALKPLELGHALAVVKPDVIIVYADILDKLLEAATIADELVRDWTYPHIITAIDSGLVSVQYPSLDSFRFIQELPVPHYTDTRTRLASIHLSSGTTGKSKGVGLTHYNYVANVHQMFAHDPDHWTAEEKIVSFTPFVHIANTTIPLFLGPWTGMCHLIMSQFDVEACCQLVQDEKATAMQLAPRMAVLLADTDLAQRYDLSSVRYMTIGGLPLTREKYHKFLAKGRGRWKTVQLYGMTEAAPYVSWQKVGERLELGQIGSLLPGIQARLCGEDGKDVKKGGPGELWIRGPNVTVGYVDNAEATAAAFRDGGWYNTGDVCTFTEDGVLRMVGRTKELIKYSGFQVAPAELESYLNDHQSIQECAVAATRDKASRTELPTAYVILKPQIKRRQDKQRVLKDIYEFLEDKVSGYKKLRGGVWEVSQLPKTGKGSVIRNRLSECCTGMSYMPQPQDRAKL